MKKFCFAAQAVLLLALVAVQYASAGNMRCGVHLISDGGRSWPGKYDVLKKCGEPTFRQGNTWIYEGTSSQFKHILHFNDSGLLARISGP